MLLVHGFMVGLGIIIVLTFLSLMILPHFVKDRHKIKFFTTFYPDSIVSKKIIRQDNFGPAKCCLVYRKKIISEEEKDVFSSVVFVLFYNLLVCFMVALLAFYSIVWLVIEEGCPADVMNSVSKWQCIDEDAKDFDCVEYHLAEGTNITSNISISSVTCYTTKNRFTIASGVSIAIIRFIFFLTPIWSGICDIIRKIWKKCCEGFPKVLDRICCRCCIKLSSYLYCDGYMVIWFIKMALFIGSIIGSTFIIKEHGISTIQYCIPMVWLFATFQVDDLHVFKDKVLPVAERELKLQCEKDNCTEGEAENLSIQQAVRTDNAQA